MKQGESSASVRRALRTVVIGGCLAMVYTVGIGSPATTEFFRNVGANELHFGLITGIPLVMLLMQFVGATVLNRVARRKAVFVVCLVLCRVLYLGVAALPLALRTRHPSAVIPVILVLLAVSAATHNFAVPFWFSWMADLIPGRVRNRVWGWRQRAMHITWSVANLGVTYFLYQTAWPAIVTFPILTVLAVAAGIADILLFLRVPEPPNPVVHDRAIWTDLRAPLADPGYRRFVLFSCAWSFSVMAAAAFMQLYVLKVLNLTPWKTSLIWCSQGLGMALASGMWGRLADRYGHRPVLIVCVALKPMIVVVFMLLTPANVIWLLPLAFLPDGMLNAGYGLASNGYMLAISPRRNRSMFIAAITGLAGMCGGLSAMMAGALLAHTVSWGGIVFGRAWNHYHLAFALSLAMRLACLGLARAIREPKAVRSRQLLAAMLDEWPISVLRFPVGLYRRITPPTR